MYPNYWVLMSIYAKEKPCFLSQAIESMLNQTVRTNDFILVCDGPLTPELNIVIEKFERQYPDLFYTLRLEINQGLGNALNKGIKICKNALIARMDSDDISLPSRCELQLKKFMAEADLSVCSGSIAEFYEDVHLIQNIRHVPLTHQEILRFARKRNPLNHMAVMYKKYAVIEAGNYIEMNLAEDYYLWVRMLLKGYKAANINEILVYARIGNGMYTRRGGISYAKKIITLQKSFLDMNFITPLEFLENCIVRLLGSLVPSRIRKVLYQNILRRKV